MKCPSCNSEAIRRSRRRGPQEGTTLRLKSEAPFRCRDCGLRFIAQNDALDPGGADRHVSFADYLGLRGWPRRVFTDEMILGSLLAAVSMALTVALFALAYGWIDLESLRAAASSPIR